MVTKIGGPISTGTAVPVQTSDSETLTVKKGDTIFSIAKELGVSVEDLLAANPGLKSGDVKPGQELKMPRPETSKESGAAEEPSGSGSLAAAEKKGEVALAEKAKASELQSVVSGETKPVVGADPKKVLKEGSKGPEVKEMQQQLNASRKEAGLPAIPETGVYDAATKKAVLDFQGSQPIISDKSGKANAQTRDLIALSANPAFQALSETSQVAVRGLLSSWKDNPAAKTNIMSIATDPAFGKLNDKETESLLAKIAQQPETSNVENIKQSVREFAELKEDANFKALDTEVRDTFTRAYFGIDSRASQARQDLASILKDPEFGKLPTSVQQQMGETFFANVNDPAYTKEIKDLVGSPTFAGLPETEQARILESVASNPEAAYAAALSEKAKDGSLSGKQDALQAIREKIGIKDTPATEATGETGGASSDPMAGLSGYTRGQVGGLMDSWKNNPVAKENLSKLASNPEFQKLDEEEQSVVLRKFIQNPERKNMDKFLTSVKEFVDVKADPDFQSLSPDLQEEFTRGFFYVGLNNDQGRADMAALLKDERFTKLPDTIKREAASAFFKGIDDPDFSKGFKDLLSGKGFAGLPETEQSSLLSTIATNPDNRLVGELARLSRLGVLDNLGDEGLTALLNEFGLKK